MHTLLFIRKTCIIPDGMCVCVLLCSLSCLAYFVLKRHENLKHSIVIQPTDAIQVLFIYFILRTTYRCSRRSFFLRFNFIVLFVHFAFGSPFCCRLLYYIFHSPFHHIALLTSFFSSLCSAFFSFVLSLSKNLFYSHFFSIHSVYFWRISSASWRNSQSGFMCNAFIYSYSSVFSPFSVDLFALIFLLRSLNVRPTFH